MMKYKVGDRVKIREWEDMAKEYGEDFDEYIDPPEGASIIPEMKESCGKETVITKILNDYKNYKMEIDGGKWNWPECALLPAEEPATEVPPKQIAYISGPIPQGKVISFLDGDKDNCDISNLVLLDNQENLELNRNNLRFQDPEKTKVGIAIVNLKRSIREKIKRRG